MLNGRQIFSVVLMPLLILVLLISGCATVRQERLVVKKEGLYLRDLCSCYGIEYSWDVGNQRVVMIHPDRNVLLYLESNTVNLFGKNIILDGPIKDVDGAIVVSSDFKDKVIDRFFDVARGRTALTLRKADTVIIDPGHGGKDPGALGRSGLKEKDVVLDVALRTKSILEKKGLTVIMTRDRDVFVPLQERTEIASDSKAQLFVSIHANASRIRSVKGLEVFMAKDLDFKDRNEWQRKHNQELTLNNLKMKNYPEVEKIVMDMLYLHKQNASRDLACQIAEHTSGVIETNNRGSKEERFYVLRNTIIPAVLIEVGFVSNPYEERLLRRKSYRKKIAYGIAESILDYVESR
ncbi:MAG: N-acetylmuramoyl-L-alanine amidase [Candidatus Omnitrophica bacterium]|nr:N-acetylmuramoyl-L-alanine amidase [Candidatus Omnitrophota bacterium]